MAEKKAPNKIYITPRGVAMYPWLNKPDTKFDADGTFKVNLKLDAEAAQPLIEQLKAVQAQGLKDAKKENPKKSFKAASLPFKPVLDESGDDTGYLSFPFAMKAKVTTKAGDVINMKPKLFDKYGRAINANIGGGSEIKVGYTIGCNVVKGEVFAKFYLSAVQVLELKSYGSRSAQDYGFDCEDVPEDEEDTGTDGFTPESTDGGDNNGDF